MRRATITITATRGITIAIAAVMAIMLQLIGKTVFYNGTQKSEPICQINVEMSTSRWTEDVNQLDR